MSRFLTRSQLGHPVSRIGRQNSWPDDKGIGAFSTITECGTGQMVPGSAGTSVAWPSANAAIYVPVRVPVPVVVTHLATATGTGTGGNFDLGIYDHNGVRVISTGSTARPGASQESIVDITDTLLRPGLYYFACALDGTNNMINVSYGSVYSPAFWGGYQQASAFPLPATATFASQTLVYLPSIAAYTKIERTKPWNGMVRWPSPVISTHSPESLGPLLGARKLHANSISSAAIGDDVACYIPFRVYEASTAVKMSVIVGATSSGDHEVGIYNAEGERMVTSGTVAQGAINTLQEFDITDTRLGPGLYFMAYQCHNATGTVMRFNIADELLLNVGPYYTESVGSPGLPSTMTPSVSTSTAPSIPLLGVHFTTLV